MSYASKTIYITYPDNLPKYKMAATEIEKKIKQSPEKKGTKLFNIKTLPIEQLKNIDSRKDELFISLGAQHLHTIKKKVKDSPIIYSFIKRKSLPEKETKNIYNRSVIYIDQPIKKLISIAEKTIQNDYKNEVLILFSENNKKTIDAIKKHPKLKQGKLRVLTVKNTENSVKVIEKHLFNAAAIIATNDKKVWSNKSARWILHQAYSYKVPVIGYSEAFLKAGALASVYSSIDDIAKTTAEEAIYWLNSGKLRKKPLTPKITTKVNKNIAKALQFSPSTIDEIEGEK